MSDYLPAEPAFEGYWQARMVDRAVRAKDTGATSITFKFEPFAQFCRGEDPEWSPYNDGGAVLGDFWIVKKDGQINQNAFQQLQDAGLWLGSFEAYEAPMTEQDRQLVVIQLKIEEYEGKARLRANWVYHITHKPQAQGIVNAASAETLKRLDAMFGPQLRALASPK